jgi:hypothetical protein
MHDEVPFIRIGCQAGQMPGSVIRQAREQRA